MEFDVSACIGETKDCTGGLHHYITEFHVSQPVGKTGTEQEMEFDVSACK